MTLQCLLFLSSAPANLYWKGKKKNFCETQVGFHTLLKKAAKKKLSHQSDMVLCFFFLYNRVVLLWGVWGNFFSSNKGATLSPPVVLTSSTLLCTSLFSSPSVAPLFVADKLSSTAPKAHQHNKAKERNSTGTNRFFLYRWKLCQTEITDPQMKISSLHFNFFSLKFSFQTLPEDKQSTFEQETVLKHWQLLCLWEKNLCLILCWWICCFFFS